MKGQQKKISVRSMSRVMTIFLILCGGSHLVQCTEWVEEETTPTTGMTLQELALENARECSDLSGLYPQDLIDGLSIQLIDEMRCMDEGWLEYYTPCQSVGCIWANGPQPLALRPEALEALREAAASKEDYITINAGYRDVAMQYFSRWRTENCDPDFPAAVPGNSNHQGGRAIDVQSYNFWWDTLEEFGFEHPLPNDRPHFEYVGDAQFRAESEELKTLGILAFQVLWNKNHPNDLIDEDGLYGPETKERLGSSPVEGFPIWGCEDGGEDPEVPPEDCEVQPCAEGCAQDLCDAYCADEPCGEGCPIEACDAQCADDPCAPGCDHSECPQLCEDFPCDEGCPKMQCRAFCLRNPCAPECGAEACEAFCDTHPCAPECDTHSECVTPDPDPCRGDGCDDAEEARRAQRYAGDGCSAGGGSDGGALWFLGVGVVWAVVQRRRRRVYRSGAM